jgi:ferritin-like metal-binding protein YciE
MEDTMAVKTLQDLFEDEVKDLYNAEKQLTKALPKMAKEAQSDSLKKAFEDHLKETENHVKRLEEAMQKLDLPLRGKKCEAMEGLISEAKDLIDEVEEKAVDAALIAAAQKVEHYEIASYGTVVEFAKTLGHNEVAKIFQQTLDEEYAADKKLNELAINKVNKEAA